MYNEQIATVRGESRSDHFGADICIIPRCGEPGVLRFSAWAGIWVCVYQNRAAEVLHDPPCNHQHHDVHHSSGAFNTGGGVLVRHFAEPGAACVGDHPSWSIGAASVRCRAVCSFPLRSSRFLLWRPGAGSVAGRGTDEDGVFLLGNHFVFADYDHCTAVIIWVNLAACICSAYRQIFTDEEKQNEQ